MYLKRLESVGFKSFAERIDVKFVPGVTAVVGPNGSGKSNITDAIRWVLGEQSAKSLRGSKMEDIIFQGSDTRKALNMAEVTLVLDNEDKTLPLDYHEVTVTRRVYRSGESEFYINKQSCRLKDIVDLFMDSGLGRESFSIIGQGQVEEILSSKADERRTIFEEAAGVLKYKQRKKEAESKLEETEANLNRVDDIIHEIEQQIHPLKKQAETAQQYLDLKEQLKEQEVSLLVTEIEQLHDEWQTILNDLEKEKAEDADLQTTIQQSEAVLEKERQTIEKLDASIEKWQGDLVTTTQQLEQLEGKKQLLNERTKHFAENKEKLMQQKTEINDHITRINEELEQQKRKLSELQIERDKTKQRAQQLESSLTDGEQTIREQIEELKSEYIELLNNQAAKRNEKQSIQQQLEQLNNKKERQTEKHQTLLTERQALTKEKEKISQICAEYERRYNEKMARIKQLKADLETKRSDYQAAQKKLYQGYQMIEKLQSKKEMLEDMKQAFQGFYQGVKAVLRAREEQILDGIYGAVIELIDIPKPYTDVIESVLGSQAQYLVVRDEHAARQAIAWLKQTDNGRATFLPLTSIRPRFVADNILAQVKQHAGFVGVASELVTTEAKYTKAIDYLMGHILVAQSLKDANDIAQIAMRKHRVVTMDGDVVNPKGSMSGGAKKKTKHSLFTREKDLQDITEKLSAYKAEANAFEQQTMNKKNQIAQLEKEIETEEHTANGAWQKWQQQEEVYKDLEYQLVSYNDSLEWYDRDHDQFEQDMAELEKRDQQLTMELEHVEKQLATIQADIDRLTKQEEAFQANREQRQHDLHAYRISLAEQEERIKNEREKHAVLQKQLHELNDQYHALEKEFADLIEMRKNGETEANINAHLSSLMNEKERITTTIHNQRAKRAERTKWLHDEEGKIKELNKKHQENIQRIQEKEVQANRLDVELENRLSHLQTEYTISFEKARHEYPGVSDLDAARENVDRLKQAIDHLGTINLGAIEEYERISERYQFFAEQRNDLVEAKETLYAVIAEMDDEMKKRFSTTFKNIKKEFAVVFRELFGGGRAELKLTDPDHLLKTGVDIVAQPPGKKLQHLGLLSGGERALTAIALLFAILRVRPVPFCVLDEVEAALDEANVVRFAKYIKMFSRDTQFIVITHRRGTMEQADVLYGVTMQESGVSRLVSVRLEETKDLVKA